MFDINAENTEELGLYFKRGSLFSELLKLPKPKPRFFNEWATENGKDYDTTSPTVYEAITYSPTCYLVADSVEDLLSKRSAIIQILSAPSGFTFGVKLFGREYHLRYLDSPSFRNLTPIATTNGKQYCEFALNLENNFQPTNVDAIWIAEGGAEITTESGDNIWVTIKRVQY
ncbi:hypothetical protein [Sphingobacterium hungaricum]|uniref:Uncharacterized protein n=1 Tax=Sphingobacterium hungaricum TaxID=2082723 RepID=A0A928YQN1_9SPHI|nr:hypothetical protein [Sphingobacterium hungaricum]MBE8712528.1 hypothetical protein [Sphingobacterium hungaricum]